MTARRAWLPALALITAAAAYWAPPAERAEVVEAVSAARPAVGDGPRRNELEGATEVAAIQPRRADAAEVPVVFVVPRWAEPPKPVEPVAAVVPPTPAAAPPAPVAPAGPPPLPFSVLGSLDDGGQPAVFVAFEGQNLVVRAGDAIGGNYRVERVEEGVLSVMHLPTQQVQTVSLGSRR